MTISLSLGTCQKIEGAGPLALLAEATSFVGHELAPRNLSVATELAWFEALSILVSSVRVSRSSANFVISDATSRTASITGRSYIPVSREKVSTAIAGSLGPT